MQPSNPKTEPGETAHGLRPFWLWAERTAWTVGLVCLIAWAALSVQRAAAARQDLSRFTDLQTAAPPQVGDPDVSDWDLERISEWRHSLEQVAPPPLAVLRIPKIKLEVAVLPGTEEFVLDRGVGHIPGTALPGDRRQLRHRRTPRRVLPRPQGCRRR